MTRSGAFGRGEYHDQMNLWLEDQFASNISYDQLVRKLLTATGPNKSKNPKDAVDPAVNFLLAHVGEKVSGKDDPDLVRTDGHFQMAPVTSRITKLFLGTQVQCAQCHDHPFYNNIKQKDFWGVNAFLRQVNREGTPPDPTMGKNMMKDYPALTLVDDTSVNVDGMVYFEKRNGVVQKTRASFLPGADDVRGGLVDKDGKVLQGVERRKALADYVVNHPMFPKEYANRMWGVFFGKGFVNPVDDFNDQNQPSNADLLNGLADSVKNYGYDQKELIRWICNSNAYNLELRGQLDQRLAGKGRAVQPDAAQVDESRAAVRVAASRPPRPSPARASRPRRTPRTSGWTPSSATSATTRATRSTSTAPSSRRS